jgi:hypothetical protein
MQTELEAIDPDTFRKHLPQSPFELGVNLGLVLLDIVVAAVGIDTLDVQFHPEFNVRSDLKA